MGCHVVGGVRGVRGKEVGCESSCWDVMLIQESKFITRTLHQGSIFQAFVSIFAFGCYKSKIADANWLKQPLVFAQLRDKIAPQLPSLRTHFENGPDSAWCVAAGAKDGGTHVIVGTWNQVATGTGYPGTPGTRVLGMATPA
eukprot:1642454-Rhodomonas_salina.2